MNTANIKDFSQGDYDNSYREVAVGDTVCYKADQERVGKITAISGDTLTLNGRPVAASD